MVNKEKIMEIAEKEGKIKTSTLASGFKISRQYANMLVGELVDLGRLVKVGSTKNAFYMPTGYAVKHLEKFPDSIEKHLRNKNLEEHKILDDIENHFPYLLKLQENVRSIFVYAFSEMLNNAIEHSESGSINILVSVKDGSLVFHIDDLGVGVFKNIMRKKNLRSELEAIQDLLKGKTTTMPKSHSGEGIYFTSKAADVFVLESFDYRLIVNNKINDIFLQNPKRTKRGTRVSFSVSLSSDRHLNDIFLKHAAGEDEHGAPAFDKTEVRIKLYIMGGVYVSRSQARRVLSGLEKFRSIVFDFDQVPMVGQAFADEIFRVFHEKYPEIKLQTVNAKEGVKFMIDRVEGNNPRTPDLFGGKF